MEGSSGSPFPPMGERGAEGREVNMQQNGRYAERLGRLRQMMADQGLDGLLCFGNPFRKDYLRYVHPAPTPSP